MSRDVGSPPRRCRVCGCTEAEPCRTLAGPCRWETPCAPDYCSACVVHLEEPRRLVPKMCRYCDLVIKDTHRGTDSRLCLLEKDIFTCSKGRFDSPAHDTPPDTPPDKHQWFASDGLIRPNKRVAEAQKRCPFFEVHRKFKGQAP